MIGVAEPELEPEPDAFAVLVRLPEPVLNAVWDAPFEPSPVAVEPSVDVPSPWLSFVSAPD